MITSFINLINLFLGLGHFNTTGQLTQVKGDINGVRITDIDSRCDTVLALSGKVIADVYEFYVFEAAMTSFGV